jgi:hypothetical protein
MVSSANQVAIAGSLPLSPDRASGAAPASDPAATSTTANLVVASIVGPTSQNTAPAPGSGGQRSASSNSTGPVIADRASSSRNANDASAELSYPGASRPANVVALPLATTPDGVSDPVRGLFPTEGGNRQVRTDSLASALAEVYRGNTQPLAPILGAPLSFANGDAGRSRLPDDGDAEALSPWVRAGPLTIAQMLEQLEDTPYEVDRLAENLPLDPSSMGQVIAQYLDEVDGLAGILTDLLTSARLRPWLHGAALVALGSVLAHRLRRKAQSDARASSGREEPGSPWLLDLHLEET